MTVTFCSRRPLMIVNSRAISPSEIAAVGSSMMMMSDSVATALAISTICFLATLRVETSCCGLMDGSRLFITLTILLILSVLRRNPNVVSSMPSVRFSSTVSWSTTLSSWNSVLIPFCFASRGLCGVYSSPFSRILPLVRCVRAGEDLDQRGFPGAVLADQAVDGVPLDVETDIVDGPHAGKILHQVPDLQHVLGQFHASTPCSRRSLEVARSARRACTPPPCEALAPLPCSDDVVRQVGQLSSLLEVGAELGVQPRRGSACGIVQ